MNATVATARPKSFWIVAIAALLWNLIGVAMFYLQVSMAPEQIAAMPAAQREVYEGTPAWLNIVFAVGVFGGVLGSLGLLLKKKWAVPLFLISMIAVLVQMASAYLFTPAWEAFGAGGLVMPVVILVVAWLLWRYSARAAMRGWIG